MNNTPSLGSDHIKLGTIAAWAILCLTIALLTFRTGLGVDFTDESLYVALIFYFTRGALPFIDELSISQNAAVLFTFLQQIFPGLIDYVGIVRTVRLYSLVSSMLVAIACFTAIGNFVPIGFRLLIASICLLFIPFNVQSISYNTLGVYGLTSGLFLLWRAVDARHSAYAFLAANCLALAAVSYPSFAIPAAVAVAGWIFIARPGVRSSMAFGLGLIPVAAVIGAPAWQAGPAAFTRIREHSAAYGTYGFASEKLFHIALEVLIGGTGVIPLAIVAAAWGVRRWRGTTPRTILLAGLIFAIMLPPSDSYMWSLSAVSNLAIFTPAILLAIKRERAVTTLLWLVWVPSVVAGLASGWSSGNGAINAGLGLFPGALVCLVLFTKVSASSPYEHPRHSRAAVGGALVALILLFSIRLFFGDAFYKDTDLSSLTARISDGPYAGLKTSPARAAFLSALTKDVESATAGAARVLYYDLFSGGYLLTPLPSLVGSLWVSDVAGIRPRYAQQLNASLETGDIVVHIKHNFSLGKNALGVQVTGAFDPVQQVIDHRCKPLINTPHYTIYLTVPTATLAGAAESHAHVQLSPYSN